LPASVHGVGEERVTPVGAGIAAEVVDPGVGIAGAPVQTLAACGDTGVTLAGLWFDGAGQTPGSGLDTATGILGDGCHHRLVDVPQFLGELVRDSPRGTCQLPQALDPNVCLHHPAGGVCSTAPSVVAWMDQSHSPSALASMVKDEMLHLPV